MSGMTLFKLCRRSGAVTLGLCCDEDGIFIGDYALVTPITDATGRRLYRARPLTEINIALSAAYGRAVDFSDRMAGLRLAARYLSAGERALAKIAAVHLRVPDLPMPQRYRGCARRRNCSGSIRTTARLERRRAANSHRANKIPGASMLRTHRRMTSRSGNSAATRRRREAR